MKNKTRIELLKEDITQVNTDAIVNAANSSLLGGGGVDGAIHRAAGPELLDECRKINGCPTGDAKITKGYRLKAKYVIHTVGPVWRGGKNNEEDLLALCYKNSLRIAVINSCKSVAFPNISTGIYHFPKELAADIAINAVNSFISEGNEMEKIQFVCFDEENYRIYQEMLH